VAKRSEVKRCGGEKSRDETAGAKQWGLNDRGETSHNRLCHHKSQLTFNLIRYYSSEELLEENSDF
jgi:hypothetical protein